MAVNPITTPLPADLPTNWTYGQTVAPAGSDAGLTEQHGYNYLMEQVNAAQEGVNTLGEAFEGLPQLSGGKIPVSELPVGTPNGVAGLDGNGKVPAGQLPAMNYIPTSQKGAAGGVATLGADGLLTPAQAYYLLLSVSAAAAYSAAATYEQGDFCTYQGQLYKANQDIGTAEAWTAAHWTATSIMAEVAALIGALDYDPGGTASGLVSQHNTDPAAHADIRAAMVTATAQISYNQGGAA